MAPDLPEVLDDRVAAFRSRYLDSEEAMNLFQIVFPLGLVALYLASIPVLFPTSWETFAGFIVTYVVPPAGKESIIPTALAAGFPAVVLYIILLDAIVGLWIVWNWDLATEVPLLSTIVLKAKESGESFLEKHEWMEDFAFLGLVLFVMVPFQGSGAIAASFVGRTISVDAERVWYAIVVGATLGSLTVAFLGQSIIFAFKQALGTGIAMVVGFVLVLLAGGYLLWDARRRNPPPHQ